MEDKNNKLQVTREVRLVEAKRTLDVNGLMNYLGIGRNRAYELMRSEGFPSVRISPRRIIVLVDSLEEWLVAKTEKPI